VPLVGAGARLHVACRRQAADSPEQPHGVCTGWNQRRRVATLARCRVGLGNVRHSGRPGARRATGRKKSALQLGVTDLLRVRSTTLAAEPEPHGVARNGRKKSVLELAVRQAGPAAARRAAERAAAAASKEGSSVGIVKVAGRPCARACVLPVPPVKLRTSARPIMSRGMRQEAAPIRVKHSS